MDEKNSRARIGEEIRQLLFVWLDRNRVARNVSHLLLSLFADTDVPLIANVKRNDKENHTVLSQTEVNQFFDALLPTLATCFCSRTDHPRVGRFHILGIPFYVLRDPETGFMYNDPRPGQAYFDLIYSDWYTQSPLATCFGYYDDKHFPFEERLKVARARAQEINAAHQKHFKELAKTSFLDVGAGTNALALGQTMKESGWDKVTVFEPYLIGEDMKALLPKERIECIHNWEELTQKDEKYDCISMLSVLEHVLDPEDYLRKLYGCLRRGGMLYVRIPDTPKEGPPADSIM